MKEQIVSMPSPKNSLALDQARGGVLGSKTVKPVPPRLAAQFTFQSEVIIE